MILYVGPTVKHRRETAEYMYWSGHAKLLYVIAKLCTNSRQPENIYPRTADNISQSLHSLFDTENVMLDMISACAPVLVNSLILNTPY